MSALVLVTNISPQLQVAHLRELFECCGPIINLQMQEGSGQAVITFGDLSHARAAVFLSGTPLGDRPLTVTTYSAEAAAQNQVPGGAPVASVTNPRAEEVGRTIYVGNVNSSLTDDHLREFFGSCGKVVLTKLAGETDGTRSTRFAFVEFSTVDESTKALALAGTVLAGFPLKIRKANNAILKPTSGVIPVKKDISAIMEKVKAAASKLDKKVEKKERSRSRSRDRSRSRRSRSRDRDRDRRSRRSSRSKSRDRSRRSSTSGGGGGGGSSTGGGRDGDIRCYNCGEFGHMSRNCSKSRSKSPPKKKKADEHDGMFFNGYKWEPIGGAPAAGGSMQAPMGTVAAILQQQASIFNQATQQQ